MTPPDPPPPKEDRPRLPEEFERRLVDTDRRAARVYTALERELAELVDEEGGEKTG